MSDETEALADTEAAAGGKGKKKAGGAGGKAKAKAEGKAEGKGKAKAKPEGAGDKSKVDGHIARLLVRAIWLQEWALAHPEAKAEERKEAWKAAREGAIEAHLKGYRRALNMLTRSGVTMNYEAPAKKSGQADEDDLGED